MKKALFSFILLNFAISGINAQIVVDGEGKVVLGDLSTSSTATVLAGNSYTGSYLSNSAIGLHANLSSSKTYTIGLLGSSTAGTSGTSRSIAIQAIPKGGTSGYLYGVIGGIGESSKNGAGIFGTTTNTSGVYVGGRYAGYFDGDVKITGTATIPTIVTPSDMRLKNNIVPLRDDEPGSSTLNKVMKMNVVKYNYSKQPEDAKEAEHALTNYSGDTEETHYGLLAQELQELYPDLVKKGQDGYLGVSYTELVPILIQAVQELKEEVTFLRHKVELQDADKSDLEWGNAADRVTNIQLNGWTIGKKR